MNLRRLATIVSLFVALLLPTAYAGSSATPSAPATGDRAAAAGVPRKVVPFLPQSTDSLKLRRAWKKWRSLHEHRYVTYVEVTCFCPTQPRVKTKVRPDRKSVV